MIAGIPGRTGLLLLALLVSATVPAQQPPNIIVMMADDLGWNDVGYHGSDISTPAIDSMAENSVRLEQFYVFPWCATTRAGFESGINPARFGMRSLEHNFDGAVMPRDLSTIAQILGREGYFTALVGKWHLSETFDGGPLTRGYRQAFGYLHGQLDHLNHENHEGISSLFRNDRFVEADGHMTDLIYREVERILEERSPPFFINVTFSAPHYPLQAPEEYLQANAKIAHPDRRLYAGMVTHMDVTIGKIVRLLEKRELLGQTIIVFLSDNGGDPDWSNRREYYDGRHGPYEVMADNRPLRGGKTEVFEGGIRVPALLHYPGTLTPQDYKGFMSVLDLLPTLSAAAGVAPPERDGRNLWPFLLNGAEPGPTDFYWFTRNIRIPHGGGNQDAVRSGNWKLIESQRRFGWLPWRIRFPWPTVELFDLQSDPYERHNLADENEEMTERLRAKLKRFRDEELGSLATQAARTMGRGSATP